MGTRNQTKGTILDIKNLKRGDEFTVEGNSAVMQIIDKVFAQNNFLFIIGVYTLGFKSAGFNDITVVSEERLTEVESRIKLYSQEPEVNEDSSSK